MTIIASAHKDTKANFIKVAKRKTIKTNLEGFKKKNSYFEHQFLSFFLPDYTF